MLKRVLDMLPAMISSTIPDEISTYYGLYAISCVTSSDVIRIGDVMSSF